MIVPQTYIAIVGSICSMVGMAFGMAALGMPPAALSAQIVWTTITYLFFVYGLNCSVLGQCNLYAWIMAYMVAIMGLFSLIVGLGVYSNRSSITPEIKKQFAGA